MARSDEKVSASSLPSITPPCPIAASRAATRWSSISAPISPGSAKSSIVVSSVMLATLSSSFAFITAVAQESSVPPMQKPSALTSSAPVTSRATSMARITPCCR